MSRRIYLDHAATSWPKPESVYTALDDYQRRIGASAGRGAYASAREADSVVATARNAVAQLIGEPDPRRVAFAFSGTDALSTALFGVLRGGDHVVSTVCEHNAVIRPLAELARQPGDSAIRYELVGCDDRGLVDPQAVASAITDKTRLVVVTHASNVTGAVQDLRAIAAAAHERHVLVLVDAAQTLGRYPLDVATLGADLIAAPGHKGLLGPLGTGLLWVRPGIEDRVRPLRHGGAASDSESLYQPARMPARFEAGSLNVPALAGLAAGVQHVLDQGVEAIAASLAEETAKLIAGLEATPGVRVLATPPVDRQAGVVTFNVEGYDPHEAASVLEQLAGIECRAGLHCAPALHRALADRERHTTQTAVPAPLRGGVRFSVGTTTTLDEIETALRAVRTLVAADIK
ncbi:aminotransferase class V-fold PLP-dependent enzyme [Botrimarina hoheduenensis]|uniref:cysteine desulfurase n=1 Tax=Botrimarina hoheduenensis TaxID=2528000 RepID=A0A5C5WDI9_9BACT|nr:aminotransferase class V-fold PLP-dependent enzyme [Botrimarina hoheduenensis]TWT48700.1 putative cysteine desulfurase [Botrimarina hoheduenensis]